MFVRKHQVQKVLVVVVGPFYLEARITGIDRTKHQDGLESVAITTGMLPRGCGRHIYLHTR